MELSLITDKLDFAAEAEQAGVERIMLDLERSGKATRQAGRDLFISAHLIESVPQMKAALSRSKLVVRINPLGPRSKEEIDVVVESNADFIMLPYFHTVDQVREFLRLVQRRTRTILLVETKSAVEALPQIIRQPGIDEVHIGLNDLSISLGHQVIFEPLLCGIIDELAELLTERRIPFGFGGIARLSAKLPVNPERILAEQVRLGASIGWLGRSFRGHMENQRTPGELRFEIGLIRERIQKWKSASTESFRRNRGTMIGEVQNWKAALVANAGNKSDLMLPKV